MNQIYFEFPFLHINNYQIMPSLIVFLIFLVILLIRFIIRVLRNLIKQNITISGYIEKSVEDFKISIKNFKFIKKILSFFENRNIWRYTFLSVTSYGMIFLLSYFLKAEKNLGDRANIIVKLANTYLKIELLVVLIMFFAFMYIFLVNKNKKAYFEFLKKPIVLLLYISAFSYAVTHQIELGYKYNWVGYILLAVFSILIFLVDIKDKIIENEQGKIRNLYKPINNYHGLCKSHKEKADALKNIIERNSDCGGISILVKGDWGIGKTSVVNGAMEKLKKDSTYEELRINALEIDSLDSLFNYFFDFIRRCLKERGAYTGIASEYREFVSSALGIVTNESFGNVFTRLFYSENKNYREKKEELEKSIGNVLGNDKIIIVVDDIERCEKEKVKQFIFFIKEIATMNNCITIFISDEKALKECILNDNENNKDINDFLDKFFDYPLGIYHTNYEEILIKIKQNYLKSQIIDGFEFDIKNSIDRIIDDFNNKIEEKEKQKDLREVALREVRLKTLKENKSLFENHMNNPRKLIKIYKSYVEYIDHVNVKNKINEPKKNFFNQINISETLFIFSYIKIYFPEQFYNIEKSKIDNYLETLNKEKISGTSEIILDIADEYWFEKGWSSELSVDFKSNYLYKKTITFLKELMGEEEISGNVFTSEEDEWVYYLPIEIDGKIDNSKLKEIKRNWLEILEVLILKRSYDMENKEKTKEYESRIICLLNEMYKEFNNKSDIFKIFSDKSLMGVIFNNIGIVSLIKNHLCKKTIDSCTFENIFDINKQYYINTVFIKKLCLVFKLVFYLDINSDKKKLVGKYLYKLYFGEMTAGGIRDKIDKDINEKYELEKNVTIKEDEENISFRLDKKKLIILMKIVLEYISQEFNLSEYNYKYNESDDTEIIIQKLNVFLRYIEDFMKTKGWKEDTVFQRELKIARLSIDDMEAFLEVIEFYSKEPTDFSQINTAAFIKIMIAGNLDNIKENIENNIKSNIANFRMFFENIDNNINFSYEQKKELDLIVDVYEEDTQDIDCNKYRRILLEYTERENQK